MAWNVVIAGGGFGGCAVALVARRVEIDRIRFVVLEVARDRVGVDLGGEDRASAEQPLDLGHRGDQTEHEALGEQLPHQSALPGTKGRSLDHIGFEVQNLEAFVKGLEARGRCRGGL